MVIVALWSMLPRQSNTLVRVHHLLQLALRYRVLVLLSRKWTAQCVVNHVCT